MIETEEMPSRSAEKRKEVKAFGHAVDQLVEAPHYKPEGRGFDSRLCRWNLSLT